MGRRANGLPRMRRAVSQIRRRIPYHLPRRPEPPPRRRLLRRRVEPQVRAGPDELVRKEVAQHDEEEQRDDERGARARRDAREAVAQRGLGREGDVELEVAGGRGGGDDDRGDGRLFAGLREGEVERCGN